MASFAAAAGLMLKLLLITEPPPAADAVSALLPLALMLTSLKITRPFASATRLVVPFSVPLPVLRVRPMDAPDTMFPDASAARTIIAGLIIAPATMSVGGCTKVREVATPALMLKLLLTAEVKPELLAVRALLPPRLMLRSLKVANPPATVLRVVVPLNVPVPLLKTVLTLTPLLVTLFPKVSCNWSVTAGDIVAPAVALLGPCTKTNWLAEAALMVKELLATEAEPLVAVNTLEPATLILKLVKVATPLPSVV